MNPSAAGSTDKMDDFILHGDRHWIDNQMMGLITFACDEYKYCKLLETIYQRIEDHSNRFQIRLKDEDKECNSDRKTSKDCREAKIGKAPNAPSNTIGWIISGSELYSIPSVRSKRLFEDIGNVGLIYKGQMYREMKTLKGTVAIIETDRKNWFKYGFMALRACIERFNTFIRQVIAIDATHSKSKTRGVWLVTVCKNGNEMIYPLAFGFDNFECLKSWTWFLEATSWSDLATRTSIDNFGSANGKRGDMINLYYRATYVYRVKEFDRLMAEIKSLPFEVYDKLVEVGIQNFSHVHFPRKSFATYGYIISVSFVSGLKVDMKECKKVVVGDVVIVSYVDMAYVDCQRLGKLLQLVLS
ncbi:hypothetical protein Ddye_012768 [Dipteronia dyeriana]|uniref:MULE transposase domain-containing protein n=1 Tax=Dipteronia dyeriana TaxID=168575 RepID=A0AAD9X572_9ROSI|nr:hypothetical protein Ddye_012768 [Dipteronia dyeriana]